MLGNIPGGARAVAASSFNLAGWSMLYADSFLTPLLPGADSETRVDCRRSVRRSIVRCVTGWLVLLLLVLAGGWGA
ncbi:MAG: hypothetical protein ACKOJF_19165, partial [Planctomycetaceae bacterium]